jgi:voltage-gated potassium channel Kch
MPEPTWKDRLRYQVDNAFSRGTASLILWLAGLSAGLILFVAALIHLARLSPERSLVELIWMSMLRTLDPGTMGGDSGSWPFLLLMLGVTLGGVFVISTLIGILTSGIEGKLDGLRKGRSRVVEREHTLILGWSNQIFTIVSELCLANQNQGRRAIVILAERDKLAMEQDLRTHAGRTGRTRLVCRTGSPTDLRDLEMVSLEAARAVIVLSPDGQDPDASVIKTILAITNNPGRRADPHHIVAEIRDPRNTDVARLVGGKELEVVQTGEIVARIIAQTCRQSGLSAVYTELLDFGGDEIYFKEEPGLTGVTFGEALLLYEDSTLIGLQPREGGQMLPPAMDRRFQPGDRVIAISEDDDTIRLSGLAQVPLGKKRVSTSRRKAARPERTLILGWNWRGPTILRELDHYVPGKSSVVVAAQIPELAQRLQPLRKDLRRQTLRVIEGDTTERKLLLSLGVGSFDHAIVLAYDELGAQRADSRTLVTLLHLRDLADKAHAELSIVSEMLDLANRELAEVTRADDFIVSDRVISLLLAQLAENKDLEPVFHDLFDAGGSEIYLKPAEDYVPLDSPVTFYDVVEAARLRGEVALGYRARGGTGGARTAGGVVINPHKASPLSLRVDDRVIVLAKD